MRKFLIVVVVALLAINVYTLIQFHEIKNRNLTSARLESSELHAYKSNFMTVIKHSNLVLKDYSIIDSLSRVRSLREILKVRQRPLLVFRFAEQHCESCVNSAIQIFKKDIESIGAQNILFLGSYRNNKLFNRVKPLYGIDSLKVYNVPELDIPAERSGYPYFFVMQSNLMISDTFIPDKGVVSITNSYLKIIYEKYFLKGTGL